MGALLDELNQVADDLNVTPRDIAIALILRAVEHRQIHEGFQALDEIEADLQTSANLAWLRLPDETRDAIMIVADDNRVKYFHLCAGILARCLLQRVHRNFALDSFIAQSFSLTGNTFTIHTARCQHCNTEIPRPNRGQKWCGRTCTVAAEQAAELAQQARKDSMGIPEGAF